MSDEKNNSKQMEKEKEKEKEVDDGPFVTRQVHRKIESIEQGEGVGARVHRSIGGSQLRNFDPFLMLDEFKVGPPAGFPDHPHRGFETVTYMLPTTKGSFAHEDFCGHHGIINGGDLQWMTAGKGILHSEMPANDKISHGLQLWVNLAAKDKMCDPAYQELPKSRVPSVTKDGVTAIVIAGSALGVDSPVVTRTPTYYLHFQMDPNSVLHQKIPKGWNAFLYSLDDSEIYVGGEEKKNLCPAHHTITLTKEGTGISVYTKQKKGDFVLLAGRPIGEPVVQHGPFVMNTQKQIMEAMMDYQSGRNGFERAPGWRSEIGRPITDHMDD